MVPSRHAIGERLTLRLQPAARQTLARYAFALAAVGVALGAKLLIDRWADQEESPFILFSLAVVLAAWYGGVGPGLAATVLAVFCSGYFFLEPKGSFRIDSPRDSLLVVFFAEGLLISLFAGIWSRAEQARRYLLERERLGRARAQENAERLTRLQAATQALSRAVTPADVASVALDQGLPALGASAGGLFVLNDEGSELELVHAVGVDDALMERWRRFPADTPVPAADAVRGRQPIAFDSLRARDDRYPHLAGRAPAGANDASAVFPLLADGQPVGALAFGFSGPRVLTGEQRAFVHALAGQCAQALERARLYEAERAAREKLDRRFDQLHALYDLTDVLGRAAGSPDEIFAHALNELERALKADRVSILLLDDQHVMRFQAWRGLSEGYREAVEGHSPWSPDERDPRPVVMPDVAVEPALNEDLRRTIRAEGIAALAFIPLVYQGRLLGKFMLYYDRPHNFTEEEVRLAENLARQLSFASERKRAEQALRESERSYRELIEGLGVAVYTTDADGRITLFNEAAVDLWGRRPELGKDQWCGSWRLYWPDGRPMPHDECPMAIALKENQPVRGTEIMVERPDGTRHFVVPYPTPLRDASGTLVGAVNALVDITERKRADDLVRMRARQQAAVAELGQRALAGVDLQPLMDEAVAVVAHTLDVEYCKVLELLPGGQQLLLRAGVGWTEGYVGTLTVDTSPDKSQAGYTMMSREPVIVEDLRSDARFGGTALLHEHDVVSGLSVMIAGKQGIFGVLGAHAKSRRRFTQDDINFLQAVANLLAEGVERKRAEEALQQSELRYRSLFEYNYDAVMSFDPDGRFTSANKACQEITGYSEAELLALPSFQPVVVPEDLVRTLTAFQKVVQGEPMTVDLAITSKEGRRVEVSVTGLPIIIDGQVTGVFGIARDITDRKRAEELIALQTTLLQSTSEASIDGILVVSREGEMISFNRRFVEMWGIPDDVVASRSDEAALRSVQEKLVDPEEFRARVHYLYDHPDEESREEVTLKDGRTFDRYSAPVRGADGALYGRVWYFRDITERKRTEEALRESEARIRAIVDTAADCIISIDERGVIQSLNPAAERLFGYTVEELAGQKVNVLMPGPYREERDGYLSHYLATGEKRIIGIGREVTGRRKDGSTFPMYLSVSEVALDGRRMFTGIVHDLTARKRAEDRLALQYAVARALAESVTLEDAASRVLQVTCTTLGWPMGALWTVDSDANVLVCEDVWQMSETATLEFEVITRQIAFPPGVGMPGRVWETGQAVWIPDVVHDDNFPRAPIAEKEGIHGAFGFPILVGNDVRGIIEFFSSEVREPDDDLLQMVSAIGRQIGQFVDRQRAERAVREGEQRLRFAMDAGGMGAWEWNMLTNDVHWSESLEAIHGRAPGTFPGTFEAYLQDVHPDDHDYVLARLSASVEEGTNDIEYRIVLPDGGIRWVAGKGQVVRDQTGRPVKMVGVCMDITERKSAEEALRQSEERFSKAFHASPAALSITRARDRRFIDVNDSFLQILGFTREEVVGRLVDEVGVWADPIERERLSEALNHEGEARNLEVTLRTKSGDIRQALGSVEVINLAGEACVLALFYDITERKRAEERERFLAKATEELSESLDYVTVLKRLAQLAVPALADWCAVDMLEEDGSVNRLAVTHADPSKEEFARRLLHYVPDRETARRVAQVLQNGRSILDPDLSERALRSAATNPDHLRIMLELGYRSAMVVPLRTRERMLGAMTLVAAESGRRYTPADLALAEELARRAALAVDNARLYREARETEAELRKANEAKDEFLGLVSHELRTPITIIYGGVQTLRSHANQLDDESRQQITDDIEQETGRLRRIIEDLLVLARGEPGDNKQVATEPVLIQRMADRLVKSFRQRNGGREIVVQCDEDLEPVAAEPVYLEQVLRNLLSNAEKYSPPDSPIELRAARNGGGELVVSVLDRGVGIAPDEVERIFERFYRSKQASRQARGVGMGLTVCKRLIEAQSGRIWARPREGGGLEVSFALPVYNDDGDD